MMINKQWHEKNRMPKNPTFAQRLEWHKAHAQHCHCREMPENIKAELKKQSM